MMSPAGMSRTGGLPFGWVLMPAAVSSLTSPTTTAALSVFALGSRYSIRVSALAPNARTVMPPTQTRKPIQRRIARSCGQQPGVSGLWDVMALYNAAGRPARVGPARRVYYFAAQVAGGVSAGFSAVGAGSGGGTCCGNARAGAGGGAGGGAGAFAPPLCPPSFNQFLDPPLPPSPRARSCPLL